MSGNRLYVRCTVATLALGLILVGCDIVGILSGDDTDVPDVDITGTYEGKFIGLGRDAGGSDIMGNRRVHAPTQSRLTVGGRGVRILCCRGSVLWRSSGRGDGNPV